MFFVGEGAVGNYVGKSVENDQIVGKITNEMCKCGFMSFGIGQFFSSVY